MHPLAEVLQPYFVLRCRYITLFITGLLHCLLQVYYNVYIYIYRPVAEVLHPYLVLRCRYITGFITGILQVYYIDNYSACIP